MMKGATFVRLSVRAWLAPYLPSPCRRSHTTHCEPSRPSLGITRKPCCQANQWTGVSWLSSSKLPFTSSGVPVLPVLTTRMAGAPRAVGGAAAGGGAGEGGGRVLPQFFKATIHQQRGPGAAGPDDAHGRRSACGGQRGGEQESG